MSLSLYDSQGNELLMAENNELPKSIFSGNKNIDGTLLEINGLNNYKLLLIDFMSRGNWYFSEIIFTKTNSHVVEIPVIGNEFYISTYDNGIRLENPRGYDLSNVSMISIVGIK